MNTNDQQDVDADVWRKAVAIRMDALEENVGKTMQALERIETSLGTLTEWITTWKAGLVVANFIGRIAKPVGRLIAWISAVATAVLAWKAWRG